MRWGDEFAKLVPRWLPKPKGCKCRSVQRKMNELDAESAASLFDDFVDAVMENASQGILRLMPGQTLRSAIESRLDEAYKESFGRSRAN